MIFMSTFHSSDEFHCRILTIFYSCFSQSNVQIESANEMESAKINSPKSKASNSNKNSNTNTNTNIDTNSNGNNNINNNNNDIKITKPITKTQVGGRNRGAVLRLQQDYINLNRDPVPYIRAEPLPWNILEWHYVITGPENSPYYGGMYHGSLVFTQQYPFKPPSIYMRTPNGRFQTNRRLCLSISDYHPDGKCVEMQSICVIFHFILDFIFLLHTTNNGRVESSLERVEHFDGSIKFYA